MSTYVVAVPHNLLAVTQPMVRPDLLRRAPKVAEDLQDWLVRTEAEHEWELVQVIPLVTRPDGYGTDVIADTVAIFRDAPWAGS